MHEFDITVVIPTFRAEGTIENCLESVFSQPSVSTEIIVVDGGSSDATISIAQRFSAPNLTIISEPDRGIYDAINKGISRAKGGLIGILGADDVYKPNVLSIVKESASRDGGIVAGLTLIDGQLRADEPYRSAALISGIPFGHNAMFASRDTYRMVGLYDLAFRICADAEWVHRAIKLGVSCRKVEQVFVEFGTQGTSSTNPHEIILEACNVIQRNFPFLSLDEAKYLLYGVRGWGETGKIAQLLQKYGRESEIFVQALQEAFPSQIPAGPRAHQESYLGYLRRMVAKVF